MESWQRSLIQTNLDRLCNHTKFDDNFLNEIVGWDIVNHIEYEELDNILNYQGSTYAFRAMCQILLSKPDGLLSLLRVLVHTEQPKAYMLLVPEIEKHLECADFTMHLSPTEDPEGRSHLVLSLLEDSTIRGMTRPRHSVKQTESFGPSRFLSSTNSEKLSQSHANSPFKNQPKKARKFTNRPHTSSLGNAEQSFDTRLFGAPINLERRSQPFAYSTLASQPKQATSVANRPHTSNLGKVDQPLDPYRGLGLTNFEASSHPHTYSTFLSQPNAATGLATSSHPLNLDNLEQSFRQLGHKPTTAFESLSQNKIQFIASIENELGEGSGGTKVYKGTFGERQVAIKQLSNFKNTKEAIQEITLLSKLDQHENIIRYFGYEERSGFILLALELAKATLEAYIEKTSSIRPGRLTLQNILKQATTGLHHLHLKNVIHRDLKPNNILLCVVSPAKVLVKISDFGISRIISDGRTSKTITAIAGTDGWIAPEVIHCMINTRQKGKAVQNKIELERETMTNKIDIFSLGCVFFYVFTDGDHPFGYDDTQYNIKRGIHSLDSPAPGNLYVVSNQHLLRKMIAQSATERPTTDFVLADPIFWSYDQSLQFLVDVSDFVEDVMLKKEKPTSPTNDAITKDPLFVKKELCIQALETAYQQEICGDDPKGWFRLVCPEARLHLETDKFTKRSNSSVLKLIRTIRNLRNHNCNLSHEIKQALGNVPDGYMRYWLKRFPLLIYHVKSSFEPLKEEHKLKTYYIIRY